MIIYEAFASYFIFEIILLYFLLFLYFAGDGKIVNNLLSIFIKCNESCELPLLIEYINGIPILSTIQDVRIPYFELYCLLRPIFLVDPNLFIVNYESILKYLKFNKLLDKTYLSIIVLNIFSKKFNLVHVLTF